MLEVINQGLETSVQDYPGRVGYLNQGFPPSGPMDSWSFRLANLLVNNDESEGALECQYTCLLYTSPSPRDVRSSRMPSSA